MGEGSREPGIMYKDSSVEVEALAPNIAPKVCARRTRVLSGTIFRPAIVFRHTELFDKALLLHGSQLALFPTKVIVGNLIKQCRVIIAVYLYRR